MPRVLYRASTPSQRTVAPCSDAAAAMADRASRPRTPHTTVPPGFTIPAFSVAIRRSVLPRISLWSLLMVVITERRGERMLVASSLPPRPTSTTATSIPEAAK